MSLPNARPPMTERQILGSPIVVDCHVHIHDHFDLGRFFDAAAANFTHAAAESSIPGHAAGALLLSEVQGTRFFAVLRDDTDSLQAGLGPWRIFSTPDPRALLIEKTSTMPLLLVAGRQVRTVEGLEVLALGSLSSIPDGGEIQTTIEQVRDAGGLPVIPWGFGKWTLARGRRIRQLIDTAEPEAFCLGDVGGRWIGSKEPALLTEGRCQGFTVLPGSDPLPFGREIARPGSSGMVLPCSLDMGRAVEELLLALRGDLSDARAYMQLESLGIFLQHQILMQVRKL